MGNEYLVDEVLSYCDRPTLAVCLRLNSSYFSMVGRLLYRVPPIIDDSNIRSFFLGALIGRNGIDEPTCTRQDCAPDREHPMADILNSALENMAKDRLECNNHFAGVDYGSMTIEEKFQVEDAARNRQWELRLGSLLPTGPPFPKQPKPRRNFKAQLLSLVQVFSLGSHHGCTCDYYAHFEGVLDNVQTLRVVPAIRNDRRLQTICDHEDIPCRFLSNIRCNKMVFRNIDAVGLSIPTHIVEDHRWRASPVEEVVFVVPTVHSRTSFYPETPEVEKDIWTMGDYFSYVSKVRVVMWPDWEKPFPTVRPLPSWIVDPSTQQAEYRIPSRPSLDHRGLPLTVSMRPEDLMDIVFYNLNHSHEGTQYEIACLDQITWHPREVEIQGVPEEGVDLTEEEQEEILEEVKSKLASLELRLDDDIDLEDYGQFANEPVLIDLDDYLDNIADRRGELNAADGM